MLANSGAIDSAAQLTCTETTENKDQRGFERIGQCDVGAFEFGASDVTFYVIPLPDGRAVVIPL